jgi:hypothetical protein
MIYEASLVVNAGFCSICSFINVVIGEINPVLSFGAVNVYALDTVSPLALSASIVCPATTSTTIGYFPTSVVVTFKSYCPFTLKVFGSSVSHLAFSFFI